MVVMGVGGVRESSLLNNFAFFKDLSREFSDYSVTKLSKDILAGLTVTASPCRWPLPLE